MLSGWAGDDTLHGTDGVEGNDELKGSGGADTCDADLNDTVSGC
jgi:Ca2+-binding RTX toxin-like protein